MFLWPASRAEGGDPEGGSGAGKTSECEPHDTCFVCLEECETKSPCECKSLYLHPACLSKVVESNGSTCTVCKCSYEVEAIASISVLASRRDGPRTLFVERRILKTVFIGAILLILGGGIAISFSLAFPFFQNAEFWRCFVFYVCFALVSVFYGFFFCLTYCSLVELCMPSQALFLATRSLP